jgi:hypothetical protein
MRHRHWCDYGGHYWECAGTAVRLFQAEPSVCMCLFHGVPMEEGDHSECSVELLSCPTHCAEQMRATGYDPDFVIEKQDQDTRTWRDAQENPIVGFCAWCGRNFYSLEDHYGHWGDPILCTAYNEYIAKHPVPSGSQEGFENTNLIDPGEQE